MLTHARLFGLEFVSGRMGDLVDCITELVRTSPGRVVTPVNVDVLMQMLQSDRDDGLVAACRESDLVIPDGMPIVWASRVLGQPLPARITGVDLLVSLCERAARDGLSVFLFGAAPGVAERAGATLRTRFPALEISGTYSPPVGFEKSDVENQKVLHALRAAAPDFLFVALGAPKQEEWIRRWRKELPVRLMMPIGGALDMLAGDRQRAPRWMSDYGFEWLWRLMLEPRRLWRRYLVDDLPFVAHVWKEWLRSKRGN